MSAYESLRDPLRRCKLCDGCATDAAVGWDCERGGGCTFCQILKQYADELLAELDREPGEARDWRWDIVYALRTEKMINIHGCLRGCQGGPHTMTCEQFRNAIANLATTSDREPGDGRLREALEPFARFCAALDKQFPKLAETWPDHIQVACSADGRLMLDWGSFREALKVYALTESPAPEGPSA